MISVALFVFILVMMLTSVLGNLLVVIAVLIVKQLRKIFQYFTQLK